MVICVDRDSDRMIAELMAVIGNVMTGLDSQRGVGVPKIMKPDSPDFGFFKAFVKDRLP